MSTKRSRSGFFALLGVVSLCGIAAGTLGACGSDADVTTGGDASPDAVIDGAKTVADVGTVPLGDGSIVFDAGVSDAACLDAFPDADIDCTGKCGPVKDLCTGAVKQCGGCDATHVCDLVTSSCVVPKVTCSDLGAECGTVKNSCGEYLDCPDTNPKGCAAGKECDPDTHKCRECQPVTCTDLGFECGSAWLGCGEDTPSNYTDCGACAPAGDGAARKCNAVFHTCEPSCTPKTAQVLCDEAKSKKGLECGVISNGCGGTVNCDAVTGYGCKNGESCGVRGIANRCDAKATPDECSELGKNCGTVKSKCGGNVKCGDCAQGLVCNANGVCGAPCTPKTCADFAGQECGTFDDTCGSTVTCGNCAGGVCNNTTKTCCATSTCAGTYAGKCGQDLANGCGQNVVDCSCNGSSTCTADGGIAPAFYAGKCGTNLPDGCGKTITVNCAGGGFCVDNANGTAGSAPASGVAGTCCTQTNTCAGQPAGSCTAVQNSCRPAGVQPITCNNNCTGGKTCVGGACCTGAAACTTGEGGECNTVKPANGCGNDRTCSCSSGRTCWCGDHQCVAGTDPAGACKAALTCGSAAYTGKCGTSLTNGVGGTINCGCPSGRTCSTTTAGATGTCACANGLGAPYTCANVPNGPNTGGDKCGPFNDGCGGTINCGCAGGETCNTSANPNACCTPAVCPAKVIGSACGTLTNNCGGSISCGCPSGAGNESFSCTAGTCQCVKDTCRGRTGPQPDRCGGTLQCGG